MTMASPEYLIAVPSETRVSVRQQRCASKCNSWGSIAVAFCLASVLGFFALGPLAKPALLGTNANHFNHGQMFMKFAPPHLLPRHPDVVTHSHGAVAVVDEAQAKSEIARVDPPWARANAVLVAESPEVKKVFNEAAGDSMGNVVGAAEEVDPQKRTEVLHKNAERATVGTGGFISGVAMSAGAMALVAMAVTARKGFQQLPACMRRHAVVVMETDASADEGVEMDSSVDRKSVNDKPFLASTIFKDQRGNLTLLDADAMLTSQAFPIAPEELIAKTKDFIACDYGAKDTDMLARNFQFVGPVVGPLSRQQYLNALDGALNPASGFPDLVGRQFGFHADPVEPGRVWWVSRPTGTFTKPFSGADPDNRCIETPPQAMGVVFDNEGRVKKINVGAVMDRTSGNSGGLGGLFAFLWFVGKPLPIRECQPYKPSLRFKLLQKIGALLTKLQKKKGDN